MFNKAVEVFDRLKDRLRPAPVELKGGEAFDSLSRETFPARGDLAIRIDLDVAVVPAALVTGVAPFPGLPPTWQMRIQSGDSPQKTYILDDAGRDGVLRSLRTQIATRGMVTEPPLPNVK